MRAGKRLKKIKHWLTSEKVFTRQDCKNKVADDWKNAQNLQFDDPNAEESNISNVQFKFSFDKHLLMPDIKMPIEFETNIASFMENIEASPVINFDDF